jgi:glycosyltransferase involved in cell wall biosynthesis
MIRSDYIIAISNFIYSEIRTKYLYTHQNVSVILRGVDINYFNPSLIDHNLLKKQIDQYSLRKNSIKIILPGRVSFWKGHAIAIEAMSYLKEKINKDFELIFVGPINNDKLKENLLNKINEFKLQDNIKFVGSSKKMNLIYSLADIVLSCSTDPEAFGRIPVEAQSMGKIIIASDHGGHKETVYDGISGFLYDPNQPQDLANAILKVLVSEQYLDKSYQLKRRNLIIENYTVEKMCQQTLEIYNKVLVA